MNSSSKSRLSSALWLLPVLAMASFVVRDHFLNSKHGEQMHQQALREFALIKPMQNASKASFADNFSSWEPRKVLVEATYQTNLPYTEIRAHYDAEMKSHGWTFAEERHLTDWGTDLGGRSVRYCKGELSSSLQYAGEKAKYGWNYALSVSWEDSSCR